MRASNSVNYYCYFYYCINIYIQSLSQYAIYNLHKLLNKWLNNDKIFINIILNHAMNWIELWSKWKNVNSKII